MFYSFTILEILILLVFLSSLNFDFESHLVPRKLKERTWSIIQTNRQTLILVLPLTMTTFLKTEKLKIGSLKLPGSEGVINLIYADCNGPNSTEVNRRCPIDFGSSPKHIRS